MTKNNIKNQLWEQNILCFIKNGQLWVHIADEKTYSTVLELLEIEPNTAFNLVAYDTVCLIDNEKPLFIEKMNWHNQLCSERLDLLQNGINWSYFKDLRPTEIFQIVIDYLDLICALEIGDFLSVEFASREWSNDNITDFIEDTCELLASHYDVNE